MDAHSGFPVHYNNSKNQCECILEYEHLFHHHPGADGAKIYRENLILAHA